jgi:hypothetical protein
VNSPLDPEFWEQAVTESWVDDFDVEDDTWLQMNNVDHFFYASGVGVGCASVFDETGSHPVVIAVIDGVEEDCECGERHEGDGEVLKLSFAFPISMAPTIVKMFESAIDFYEQQWGPIEPIGFGDAG